MWGQTHTDRMWGQIISCSYVKLDGEWSNVSAMLYWSQVLCHTIACFHVISISLISSGDHVMLTTFCGYYPCVHYFYVPWLIMTSQWVMTLLRMPQWVMTLLGTPIVMSQWVMTLLCVHIMASQYIIMLLSTSFARYYYAKLWYCCFTSKLFKLYT